MEKLKRSVKQQNQGTAQGSIVSFLHSFLPSAPKPAHARIPYLDLLKLAAAFWVVFYHFAYYKLDYGFLPGQTYVPNAARWVMCFASCSIPLFFFIHGTLLFSRPRTWRQMYAKAAKLLVLILVWSVLDFPSWFFGTLVILYLLFPLFQYLKNQHFAVYLLLCGAVLVFPFLYNFALWILRIFCPGDTVFFLFGRAVHTASFSVTGFFTLYAVFYFLTGPLLAEKKPLPIWTGVVLLAAGWALVTAECTVYTNLNQSLYDGVNAAFPTIGALLLSAGVFSLSRHLPLARLGPVLAWLSDGILPIYVLHMGLIHGIRHWFGSLSLGLAPAVGGSLVIMAACIGIGKLMRRIPVLCWLVRI